MVWLLLQNRIWNAPLTAYSALLPSKIKRTGADGRCVQPGNAMAEQNLPEDDEPVR